MRRFGLVLRNLAITVSIHFAELVLGMAQKLFLGNNAVTVEIMLFKHLTLMVARAAMMVCKSRRHRNNQCNSRKRQ